MERHLASPPLAPVVGHPSTGNLPARIVDRLIHSAHSDELPPRSTSSQQNSPESHAGKKRHKCNICGSTWGRPSSLRIHMVSHTGVKEFVCFICNQDFGVKSNYTRHIRVHHRGPSAPPLLRIVAEVLTDVLKYYHQPMANRRRIESLIPRVEGLAESMDRSDRVYIQSIEEKRGLVGKLRKPLQDLRLLKDRGESTGYLDNIRDAERLTDLTEGIRDAVMGCQAELQQDIYDKNIQGIEEADLLLLEDMHHIADAAFSAGNMNRCLRGTRKDVLLQIEQWSADQRGNRVFWLTGPAGSGKSTIARTFAEISFFDGKLGASFFCSRDFKDRSNLQVIFPTLAFQLAHRYAQFREQLLQVLSTNPGAGRGSLCSQLEKLIVGPLKVAQISTLVVIDALDECKDTEPASALLFVLSRYVHEIPDVKFFISSRTETPIQEGFQLESLRSITDVLDLYDVERSSVDEEIRLYIKTRLTHLKRRRGGRCPDEWPSSHDIDILCKKAAGLFIYASKVIKFVASENHLCNERLDLILSPRGAAHELWIDPLYAQTLKLAFRGVVSGEEGPYSHFSTIVGTVLLAFYPPSIKTVSDLVRNYTTSSHISITLRSLNSLLNVPDSEDGPIRRFHESFTHFLTDRTRCKDERFFVDPPVIHQVILFSCLDLMEERLKKNICDLDDYTILDEVENLATRRETRIGSSLEYACRFWTRHLAKIPCHGPHIERVQEAIGKFISKHLLHWIEILSIAGHLGVAIYAIHDIRRWYSSVGISPSRQVDDLECLILENFNGIRDSPSHIYHSALPLLPPSSWLRECYEAELAQEVRVLMGLPDRWDTCSRRISTQGEPSAFAHWGDIIGVGLGSSTVVLLDAITGNNKSILSGHTDIILSLTFSLDGTLLVSGSEDKTVKLWDVQTGGVVKTFSDRSSSILAVSISLDHATIASGAEDGTICLWDVRTGRCHPMVLCHDGRVTALSFSPIDPRRLISSSWDRTVRLWDVGGHQVGVVCHETGRVAHVAYASGGTRFVLCGGTVATIRDSESGAVVVKLNAPKQSPPLRCCCFSPDGRSVACVATDTIYVWDITGSEAHLVGNLVGHSKPIVSIAFSASLISASTDRSVRVWQSNSFPVDSITTDDMSAQPSLTPVECVRVLAEDDIVVTSDSSGMVKIWDLTAGGCDSSFSTPARGTQDIHLAGDTLIVVWWTTDEKEYRVWDIGEGQLLRTMRSSLDEILELRISGDGTKIFGLGSECIEVWSIQTGEDVGHVELRNEERQGRLVVHGSIVWLTGSGDVGWDFGGQEARRFSLSRGFMDRPRLDLVDPPMNRMAKPAWVRDMVTGRAVFYLPERHMKPGVRRRLDGRHLLVWSRSGEVVVIDLSCVFDRDS